MYAELESRYSVKILPTAIIGKRWAFKGDRSAANVPLAVSHRIPLSENEGVIVYGWDTLDETQKYRLTAGLKAKFCDS